MKSIRKQLGKIEFLKLTYIWFKELKLKTKFLVLGPEKLIKQRFMEKKGYQLDFDNVMTYSEKIQKRKLYSKNKLYALCADKYLVREYVKEKIGEEHLIPLYFAKSKINVKDLEELPNSFAIKTNNGSGTNKIVFDKSNEDLKDIVKIMNRYRKKEYGYKSYEMFYNMIKPMIVAEKLLLTKDGQPPYDYKIHCFKQKDGKFKHFIQVDYDRFTDHGRNIYDEKWNLEPYTLGFKTDSRKIKKPKNFKKMLELADKLAVDFDYVRVDFYLVDKQIFFGELTFAHGSGFEEFAPEKYDKLWGGYWNQEI